MDLFLAFIYVYKHILMSGNLDFLYAFAVAVLVYYVCRGRSAVLQVGLYVLPFVLIVGVTAVFSSYAVDLLQVSIYIAKLVLNLMLMIWVRDNYHKINMRRVVKYTLLFYTINLGICFMFYNNTYLWRVSDVINKYNLRRLKMFTTEPGDIATNAGLVLVIIICWLYRQRHLKHKDTSLLYGFGLLSAVLILAASLNGYCMVAGIFGLFLLVSECKRLRALKINKIAIGIIIAGVVSIMVLIITDSSIILRIQAVLSGNDSSGGSRFNAPLVELANIWEKTNYVGTGLGNIEIATNIAYPNSFLRFMGEGGVPGALYIIALVSVLIYKAVKSRDAMCIAVVVVFVLLQIPGGYFTDPFNWMVYGYVLNRYQFRKKQYMGKI